MEALKSLITYLLKSVALSLRAQYRKYKVYRTHQILVSSGTVITLPEAIEIGVNFSHGYGCKLYCQDPQAGSVLKIGDNVSLNDNVTINADYGGEIRIGNQVLIGPDVVMRAANHGFERKDIPIKEQGHFPASITLEDDVWIGAGVIVLPGVTIQKGAVVGAGSVVTESVESYSVVAGIPAREIKKRV